MILKENSSYLAIHLKKMKNSNLILQIEKMLLKKF